MKAVVFRNVGDIRLDDVPEPKIEQPTDAIVRLTASAIAPTRRSIPVNPVGSR
jgi:threonine dehydrogenase-like Zn-dependent dehydrogenase